METDTTYKNYLDELDRQAQGTPKFNSKPATSGYMDIRGNQDQELRIRILQILLGSYGPSKPPTKVVLEEAEWVYSFVTGKTVNRECVAGEKYWKGCS